MIKAYEGGLFTHVESSLSPGAQHEFRLRCLDGSGWTFTGAASFVAPGRPPLGIRVSPNPALGELNVFYSLSGNALSSGRVEVFDLSGRRVLEQRLSGTTAAAGV